ncbi:MAG: hypothetical protein Q8N21_03810 [bacterium]|nr:hypothetical protein [bacterium]
MKIKDLPKVDRPREKLIAKGAENLKDSELLAILLRTGKAGKNVIEIASQILTKHSNLAFPPPPNFVFRFAKCAAKEDVALAPALPCAPARRSFSEGGGNNKELPFCLPNFNIFDTIVLSKLIYTQCK